MECLLDSSFSSFNSSAVVIDSIDPFGAN